MIQLFAVAFRNPPRLYRLPACLIARRPIFLRLLTGVVFSVVLSTFLSGIHRTALPLRLLQL